MVFKWDVLVESLKEPARIIIFAIVSWLLTVVVPQLPPAFIPIATIVLKLVDEYAHQVGKTTDNPKLITGITRF